MRRAVTVIATVLLPGLALSCGSAHTSRRIKEMGVDGIITDYPNYFSQL